MDIFNEKTKITESDSLINYELAPKCTDLFLAEEPKFEVCVIKTEDYEQNTSRSPIDIELKNTAHIKNKNVSSSMTTKEEINSDIEFKEELLGYVLPDFKNKIDNLNDQLYLRQTINRESKTTRSLSKNFMVDVEKLIEEVRKYPVLYDQTSDKYRNSEYKERIWNNISTTLQIKGGIEECKKKWSSVRDQFRRTLQKRKTASGQAAARYRKYKYEDILEFLLPYFMERDTLSNVPNLEQNENEDEYDEIETSITDTQEEINEQNIRNVNEEPTEIQNQSPFTDNTHQTATSNTSSVFMKKNKFAKPVASLKRKTFSEEKTIDSPANTLMAYIIAEKEQENKRNKLTDTVKDPVDAFLGGIAPTLKSLNPILLNEAKSKIFSLVQEFEMKQLMSTQNQCLQIRDKFTSFSPMSSSQSVSTLSTTPPYPSPLSDETTNSNDPVYYQINNLNNFN